MNSLENIDFKVIKKRLSSNDKLSKEEFNQIFNFLCNNLDEENTFDLLVLLDTFMIKSEDYPIEEEMSLCVVITKIYYQDRLSWRGRTYANRVLKHVIPLSKITKEEESLEAFSECFSFLGGFYATILDARSSRDCYLKAYEIEEKLGTRIDNIISNLRRAVIQMQYLPENERDFPDSEELIIKYKDKANAVIDVINGKGYLKHDPIEQTEKFQAVYDEVQEAVEKRIKKEGDLHLCHQRWNIMANELSKRGIHWRSLGLMNPRVRFD